MYNSFKKVPNLTNCVTSHALYIFLSQMIIILHVGNACGILGETKCNLNSIFFAGLAVFDSCVAGSGYAAVLSPTYKIIILKSVLFAYCKVGNNPHKIPTVMARIKKLNSLSLLS